MIGVMMKMMSGKMNKGKKIIVFGVDNSGKTTLAKAISGCFGFSYAHSLGPVPIDKMLIFMDENLNNDVDIVFDRFPIIEEFTCGEVIRGFNKFSNCPVKEIEGYLNKVDLFIYCNPDINLIVNWGDREQMHGVKENVQMLKTSYDKYYDYLISSGYNVVCYDWNDATQFKNISERVLNL